MRIIVLIGCLLLAAGCKSNPRRPLIFTTSTKIGLDLSATGGALNNATFGYKRFEGAILPVRPENSVDAGTPPVPSDAPSVFAAIDLENSWLKGIKLFELFATGQAAIQASTKPDWAVGLLDARGRSKQ